MAEERRIFSEKQASEILARAARLQEGQGAYAAGLTREELLSVAAEAGIDPQNVESAILALSEKPKRSRFLNLVEHEERVVDAELDPEEFDVILDVAKPARARRHPARQVGRTLMMQTRYKGGIYNVEVASRSGRTRIEVASVPLIAYFMSLHPALLIAIIGGANLGARGQTTAALLVAFFSMALGLLAFVGLVRHGKDNRHLGRRADSKQRRSVLVRSEDRSRLRRGEAESPPYQSHGR